MHEFDDEELLKRMVEENPALMTVGFQFNWSDDGRSFQIKFDRSSICGHDKPLSVIELIHAFRAFWVVFEDKYSNTVGGEQ